MRARLPAALAAATMVISNATAPASAGTAGPAFAGREVFRLVILTPGQSQAHVTARGAFRASGHYVRRTATIVFPKGRIRISRHALRQAVSGPDPSTCRFKIWQSGTFRVVRATGRYRGLRERGSYRTTITARLRKAGADSCTSKLVAFHEVSYLTGHAR